MEDSYQLSEIQISLISKITGLSYDEVVQIKPIMGIFEDENGVETGECLTFPNDAPIHILAKIKPALNGARFMRINFASLN